MVVPGQGDGRASDKSNDVRDSKDAANQLIKETQQIGGTPAGAGMDQGVAGSVERLGLTSSADLLAAATRPSEAAVFQRSMTEEAENNFRTAQQMLATPGGVMPEIAPQFAQAVKGMEAMLAQYGITMGDEAAATKQASQ